MDAGRKSICLAVMTVCLLPAVALAQGNLDAMGCGTVQKQASFEF